MTPTILVVDDEPDLEALVLQKFRKQIRDGAVNFVFARDGIEALQSIEAHPHVDMVVSDINMPHLSGLEAAQRIAAQTPSVAIVILSMHSDEGYVLRALKAGARSYLLKDSAEGDLIEGEITGLGVQRNRCVSKHGVRKPGIRKPGKTAPTKEDTTREGSSPEVRAQEWRR